MNKREALRQYEQENTLLNLGFTREEAEALRRISMTLQRWHERECGTDNGCIERGWITDANKVFVHDENGKPYFANHSGDTVRYYPIRDMETGARKRLAAILDAHQQHRPECNAIAPIPHGKIAEHAPCSCGLKSRETLTAYIQGDPRGAALYIIRPGDVPEGGDVNAYYSRGICVY
jgi:hypothetical protein